MTIQQAYQQLLLQLYDVYDNREAANIADMVIEKVSGFKKIDRIINKAFPFSKEQEASFTKYSKQLLENRPVQYVLEEAWFAGIKLFVDENVLIPRPETEELLEWIEQDIKNGKLKFENENHLSILDIGTGSGCLPIALKKNFPAADVSAIDVSEGALNVAKRNAEDNNVAITFHQFNFLDESNWQQLQKFDVIVSNPPYIKKSEEKLMEKNVLSFEPHLALFVPDEDALIFYRKIASFGQQHLKKSGAIFFEINEALGKDVVELLNFFGYRNVEIRQDMQGKDRMVSGVKSYDIYKL